MTRMPRLSTRERTGGCRISPLASSTTAGRGPGRRCTCASTRSPSRRKPEIRVVSFVLRSPQDEIRPIAISGQGKMLHAAITPSDIQENFQLCVPPRGYAELELTVDGASTVPGGPRDAGRLASGAPARRHLHRLTQRKQPRAHPALVHDALTGSAGARLRLPPAPGRSAAPLLDSESLGPPDLARYLPISWRA